ncbi:hypothetical protein RhiJN_13200 [Ceratobasidium sp. AG-Ba]|nr:hypothetical protein RhiJN_13200 [Ceratobasidium sp. AG-Ba]
MSTDWCNTCMMWIRRDGETRDMTDHLRPIKEELFDLSTFLRERRPTPPAQPHPSGRPLPNPRARRRARANASPTGPSNPTAACRQHVFKEYVPGSDATTDISLTVREEEPTPIARTIMPRPTSDVSSLDLSESIESMSDRSSTAPSGTVSEESSVSHSMLFSSVITLSPSPTISDISVDRFRTPSVSIRKPQYSPISVNIPILSSNSSGATPELCPPSSKPQPLLSRVIDVEGYLAW